MRFLVFMKMIESLTNNFNGGKTIFSKGSTSILVLASKTVVNALLNSLDLPEGLSELNS